MKDFALFAHQSVSSHRIKVFAHTQRKYDSGEKQLLQRERKLFRIFLPHFLHLFLTEANRYAILLLMMTRRILNQ